MSTIPEAQSSPAPKPELPADDKGTLPAVDLQEIRIPPLAFLRSMAVILWSALRHPFQTTEVDLSTGKVIRRY
jgi:hypothetical protein